jgi:hypothetical protein
MEVSEPGQGVVLQFLCEFHHRSQLLIWYGARNVELSNDFDNFLQGRICLESAQTAPPVKADFDLP